VLEGALASGLGTGGIGMACEQAFEATSAQVLRLNSIHAVKSTTHGPQKLTGLSSLYTNPVSI
jgi:hypothetical protein